MSYRAKTTIEASPQRSHLKPSRTIRSTTDQQPQTTTRVKAPFRLIPVVPPKKSSKVDMDLRLEPEIRRPLSPVHNSTTHAKVVSDRRAASSLVAPSNDELSGPSENDCFENIDERELPMLTDNYDDIPTSQPTVISRPNQQLFSEPESGPSTLNGPPGLLIGERISVLELTKGSSLSQSDVSFNALMTQSECNIVGSQIELEVPPNQQATATIRLESAALSTGNKPVTTLSLEPIVSSRNQVNIISEASNLDGPSGLSIGEGTHGRTVYTSTTSTHVGRIECQKVASNPIIDNNGSNRCLFSVNHRVSTTKNPRAGGFKSTFRGRDQC